jgi:hypothetical protein
MAFKAGVAKVKITPPVGIALAGFAARQEGCRGIHDDLYAKALVLDDGCTKVAVVTCDFVGPDRTFVEEIRRIVEERTGIEGAHVMVCGSHTHSGPMWTSPIFWDRKEDEDIEGEWAKLLPRTIAGAVLMAADRLEEAKIGFGAGEANVGINRRLLNEAGKVGSIAPDPSRVRDPQVGVVRVDRADGRPLAVLVNYACHAVVLGADNFLISADYPGYAMRTLERVVGDATVLFANGCCGNINPQWRGSFEAAERSGNILAGEALKVLQEIEPSSKGVLRMEQKLIHLPIKAFPALDEAKQVVGEKKALLSQYGDGELPEHMGGIRGELIHAQYRVSVIEGLAVHQSEEDMREQRMATEMQGLTVGDAALVMLPGEMFAEIGLEIKERSPFGRTSVIGYANDYGVSYVPTAQAYEEGGYEPDWAKVAPGADRVVVEEAVAMLSTLNGNEY